MSLLFKNRLILGHMYAIIDIETTGGSPVSEKVTEIAIYIHDGKNIIDEYSTLINPERKIPYHITQLTGISNSMVADAPKFYEVARKIVELTENMIFVAHNVTFDYSFIVQEFKQLGYEFKRNKLCTVNLGRKYLPGYRSYSLGTLCKELGIKIEGRHRAAGDALATVKLFELILQKTNSEQNPNPFEDIPIKDLHPNLDPEVIRQLPDKEGVYYFYNDKNDLIYIGKSKNIHSRILSHFRNTSTKKSIEMRNNIASIDFELTGNELIALLKESNEIKQNKPLYNRAQRRSISQYGLYTYVDRQGYIRFELGQHKTNQTLPICNFTGLSAGKLYLQRFVEKYRLCQKLCGLYQTNSGCFHYEIMECDGACLGKEEPESYNARASRLIEYHRFKHNSFFIVENGRYDTEKAIVMIENGKYNGFGYIDNTQIIDVELLKYCIKSFPDDSDIQQILRTYLRTGKPLDLIPFK